MSRRYLALLNAFGSGLNLAVAFVAHDVVSLAIFGLCGFFALDLIKNEKQDDEKASK